MSTRGERDTGEGKGDDKASVGLTRILLGQKIKKIDVIDSADTNGRYRFKAAMN
jgi:hypothetical protein